MSEQLRKTITIDAVDDDEMDGILFMKEVLKGLSHRARMNVLGYCAKWNIGYTEEKLAQESKDTGA